MPVRYFNCIILSIMQKTVVYNRFGTVDLLFATALLCNVSRRWLYTITMKNQRSPLIQGNIFLISPCASPPIEVGS